MLRSCALLLLATLLLQFHDSIRWGTFALAGLVSVDLILSGGFVNFYAPEQFYLNTPEVVKSVRNHIKEGRFFRETNPTKYKLHQPSSDIFWKYRWDQEVLNADLAAYYLIPSAFNSDPDATLAYDISEMTFAAKNLPLARSLPLLSSANVNIILTPDAVQIPEVQPLATIHNASNLSFFLYENKNFMPRVAFVQNWIFHPDCDQMLRSMLSPNFDPSRFVTLEGKSSPLYLNACKATNKIREIRQTIRSSVIELTTECNGYVVFSESFNRGWKIRIDGAEAFPTRANCAYFAVYVKRGIHKIEKIYSPISFRIGIFVSLLSVVVLMVLSRRTN